MNSLEKAFLFIAFQLEGKGYDNKDIKTIYGITQKNYPNLYQKIVDADKTDNSEILREAILQAYNTIYNNSSASLIAYPLNIAYFDMVFNAGEKSATKCVQTVINYYNNNISVDGIFGNETEKHLDKILTYIPANLFTAMYLSYRKTYYVSLGKARYIKGWCNRVDKLTEYLFGGR